MGEIEKPKEKGRNENMDLRIREILLALGYDPEDFDPDTLTIQEFREIINAGAFDSDGIVISGDHGDPIDTE
ncbi:MAG: hypothetical protein RBT33_01750 [Candidatus Dojkabacteria bacterium]|jgi:hypothetical protein|nr:hypothetical protein [Candidatus Dojkabacteria bacterium]